ncbi:MAG: hypothetical protein ACLFV0_04755 [Nitriliruptoraceae bacterium]
MTRDARHRHAGLVELVGTLEQLERIAEQDVEHAEPAAVLDQAGVARIAGIPIDGRMRVTDFEKLGDQLADQGGRTRPDLVERLFAHQRHHSSADVARSILQGLLPMLRLSCYLGQGEPPDVDATGQPSRPQHRPAVVDDLWLIAVRLAQVAVWLVQHQPEDPRARELLPRALETRFLLASAPLRATAAAGATGPRIATTAMPAAVLDQLLEEWRGTGDAGKSKRLPAYHELAWDARAAWLACLDNYELHPSLVADGPDRLDERIAWVVFPSGLAATAGRRGPLPSLRANEVLRLRCLPQEPRPATDRDRPACATGARATQEEQLLLHLASDHLLPRYLLSEAFGVLKTVIRDRPACSRGGWTMTVVTTLVPGVPMALGYLGAVVVLLLAFQGLAEGLGLAVQFPAWVVGPGAVTAIEWFVHGTAFLWLAALAVTVGCGGRAGSYLGLLRLPAAVAFGLALLVSLGDGWAGVTGARTWVLPLVMLGVAFAYLLVEVVNQGAEQPRVVLRRVRTLASIGLGVATMITGLALWLIVPLLLPAVEVRADVPTFLRLLFSGASAAFAVGVFLQAIWDESPVTAPLSRVRLR